jgi:hypothetical protein
MDSTAKRGSVAHHMVLWALVPFWAFLVVTGTGSLSFHRQAGAVGRGASLWPDDTALARGSGKGSLLVVGHADCACTAEILRAVSAITTRAGSAFDVTLLFVRPPGAPDDWTQSAERLQSEGIPGVHVFTDRDGREAKRFGASTSGRVLAYDAAGALIYSGGFSTEGGRGEDELQLARALVAFGGEAKGRAGLALGAAQPELLTAQSGVAP